MKIIELINETLKKYEYDGLVNPGLCGCVIDDLSPGNCLCDDCEAGYKHSHSETKEWIISTGKDILSDDEIQDIIDGY